MLVVLAVSAVERVVQPLHLPDFYSNAVSAFVATSLAWTAYALGAQGWIPLGGKDFAFIVAGGIVALLPGRTMASAVEDVISGYAVTGAGRLLAVTVSLTGLIIGVAVALGATIRLTEALSFTLHLSLGARPAHQPGAVVGLAPRSRSSSAPPEP